MCQLRWVFKLGVILCASAAIWSLLWSLTAFGVFLALTAAFVVAADFPLWCEQRATPRHRRKAGARR
jgi:hypothetical protein